MTWEEMFAAITALGEASLMMRAPGDWYVSARVDIGGDGALTSATQSAPTPEDAVREWWARHVVGLEPHLYLVVGSGERRKRYRWNGFMWRELPDLRDAARSLQGLSTSTWAVQNNDFNAAERLLDAIEDRALQLKLEATP